ncbi:MAG: hypothetical protein RR589_17295 [Hafnia sp.]|uniref:hypothetical protein n=1 Tax=Hafnia sp. TaxID=1873498 RepID=UPI002FCAEBB5
MIVIPFRLHPLVRRAPCVPHSLLMSPFSPKSPFHWNAVYLGHSLFWGTTGVGKAAVSINVIREVNDDNHQ